MLRRHGHEISLSVFIITPLTILCYFWDLIVQLIHFNESVANFSLLSVTYFQFFIIEGIDRLDTILFLTEYRV
jgi:hypothetical protein